MKYTSLFSAVAVAAAMSTQAFATVTTNDVGAATFEEAKYGNGGPISGLNLTPEWSVQSEDASEIITAPLSTLDSEGYTGNNRLLKLNTEGQELVWNPGTVQQPEALIEMKVKLVASDTEPAISSEDQTIHAAVFLKIADETNPSPGDGLYAYTDDGWQLLDTTNMVREATGDSNATGFIANGSTVALRVLMNYNNEGTGAKTATYEGALITDGVVGTFFNLGTKNMANPASAVTQGQLASIAFKGTGGVDDLFVRQITRTASTASISLEIKNEGQWEEVSTGSVDTADPEKAFTAIDIEVPENMNVTITVCDAQGEVLATLPNTVLDDGALSVSCEDYAGFQPNTSYKIRIEFTDPTPPAPTYTGPKSNGVQVLVAADETTYEATPGNEFIPLAFTSFTVNGSTVTAGLTGTFIVDDDASNTANFALVSQTTLGGAEDRTVTGALTVTGAHTATLTFTMPQGDTSRFIKGLYVADPAN